MNKYMLIDAGQKPNIGAWRVGCRNRLWGFWVGVVIIGVEVVCLSNAITASSPYLQFLGKWGAQICLGLGLELLAVISLLVRLDGPLLVVQSPFRDSLVIHDRSFRSSKIRPVARKIQSQLPRWIDDGYKEISMRSHLFGSKSEDELKLMALTFSCQCNETPQIFVFKKKDFLTWLNKLSLKIFRPRIRVSEQDGIIIFKSTPLRVNF